MRQSTDNDIASCVSRALTEDIGTGDLTAGLLPKDTVASATIVTRSNMVVAGRPWVEEVYRQIDSSIQLDWRIADGDDVEAGTVLCKLLGPAPALLTGERTALNFLQTLSATATTTARHVAAVADTSAKILDTRKTIPGLRSAQKYAVRCGGGTNHRFGLFDAILIKENHILASGGIAEAIRASRSLHGDLPVEIEVEDHDELRQALRAKAERILLDNFDTVALLEAVAINRREGDPRAMLEASGGLTIGQLRQVAQTGVDYISVGALTKNVEAVDLSMRFDLDPGPES